MGNARPWSSTEVQRAAADLARGLHRWLAFSARICQPVIVDVMSTATAAQHTRSRQTRLSLSARGNDAAIHGLAALAGAPNEIIRKRAVFALEAAARENQPRAEEALKKLGWR